jgi:oligoribonuclease NrnB/cAMP/cGMP phosphodiesterase (DHH superfamily)
MNTTVLYHGNCPDGHAAAYACWLRFKDTAQYLPVFYGQEPPAIPDDHNLYIVDFSYAEPLLKALLDVRLGRRQRHEYVVTVLDHHASAQRDLASLQAQDLPGMQIVFDLTESGASLTWKYLQNPRNYDPDTLEQALPTFFKYIRDRDLWQWKLPDSKAISLAYWCLDKDDFLNIDQFAHNLDDGHGYRQIVTQGHAMEAYAHALVKEQAARLTWGDVGGYSVPIVNTTTLFSEVGDYLCTQYPAAAFCAYYFTRTDGKRQWGLRGHGKVDLSMIAAQYGGGGHHDAAGFVQEATGPILPRTED